MVICKLPHIDETVLSAKFKPFTLGLSSQLQTRHLLWSVIWSHLPFHHITSAFSLLFLEQAWRCWGSPGQIWLCSCDRLSRRQTGRQTAFCLCGCSACCCSCPSVCCCCNWSSFSAGNSDRVGTLLTFHVMPSGPLATLYLVWSHVV